MRTPGTKEPAKPSDVPMETMAKCTGAGKTDTRMERKIMLAGDAGGCVSFKLATRRYSNGVWQWKSAIHPIQSG